MICKKCEQDKDQEEFHKNGTIKGKVRYHSICKECKEDARTKKHEYPIWAYQPGAWLNTKIFI